MQLVETQIREEGGSNPGFKVEFSGNGGEIISVMVRQSDGVNRENVVEKARALMIEVGNIAASNDAQQTHEEQSKGDFAR